MFDLLAAHGMDIEKVRSNPNALPGHKVGEDMLRGVIFYALLASLVGVVLSSGLWAVGSFSNNYTQSINGKKGTVVACACALMIGAAYAITRFFFQQGDRV